MKKLLVVLVSVMCLLTLVGCGGNNEAASEGNDAVKIGCSGPLTGGAAQYGLAVKAGAEIAVEEINAKDGLKLELNFLDDEADGEKAANAYAQLQDWGMQVSMLTVTTGSALAVNEMTNDEGIFAMTPSGSAADIIANKEYIYRMCFADPEQGTAAADMIADKGLGTKAAIFTLTDDEYSTGVADAFKAEAANKGIEIVYDYKFTSDNATDFPVKEAQDKGAEVCFLPLYYENDTKIIMACQAIGYNPVFFGVDGFDGALAQDGVDPAIFEDVYYLTPFAYSASDDATKAFTEKYVAKTGGNPNQFAADGYDVVYAIYNAMVAANVTADMSAQDIGNALKDAFNGGYTYSGLTGANMTWNSDGAVLKTPLAFQIKSGTLVAVD